MRGSYTLEASLISFIILLVLIAVLIKTKKAEAYIFKDWQDSEIYQEAFIEKINDVLLEKVHREMR